MSWTSTAAADATLASPLEYPPARPRPLVAAITALLLGGVLAAVTRPYIGLAVGVATAAVLLVPRTRGLLTAAAVGLMVAAGTVVVVDQATAPAQAGGTWPPTFSTAALLAWGAVACLVADAVAELVTRAAPPQEPDDPAASTTQFGPSA